MERKMKVIRISRQRVKMCISWKASLRFFLVMTLCKIKNVSWWYHVRELQDCMNEKHLIREREGFVQLTACGWVQLRALHHKYIHVGGKYIFYYNNLLY